MSGEAELEELHICPLGSGSKGNCVYVGTRSDAVLIDGGFSGKETLRRLELAGFLPEAIRGVLLTHEHGDHIRGVRPLSRKLGVPAYMTRHTYLAIGAPPLPDLRLFAAGDQLEIGPFLVDTIPLPHDAVDPVAFAVQYGERRVGCVTDLGYPAEAVVNGFGRCDFLVLEANHDVYLLETGPYPWSLKRRILGDKGHLSNRQGAELLSRLAHPSLKGVILAHLSEKNNDPDLAEQAFRLVADKLGLESLPLWVAKQGRPLTGISI